MEDLSQRVEHLIQNGESAAVMLCKIKPLHLCHLGHGWAAINRKRIVSPRRCSVSCFLSDHLHVLNMLQVYSFPIGGPSTKNLAVFAVVLQ